MESQVEPVKSRNKIYQANVAVDVAARCLKGDAFDGPASLQRVRGQGGCRVGDSGVVRLSMAEETVSSKKAKSKSKRIFLRLIQIILCCIFLCFRWMRWLANIQILTMNDCRQVIINRSMSKDIAREYQAVIDNIFDSWNTLNKKGEVHDTYKKAFEDSRQKIIKLNGLLEVVMDNEFAHAILKKIKELDQTMDSKRLERQMSFFVGLARHVQSIGFITKRKKMEIDAEVDKKKSSLDYILNSKMNLLIKSDNRVQFRGDFFKALGIEDVEDMEEEDIIEEYRKFYQGSLQKINRKILIKMDSVIAKFQDRQTILGPLLASIDQHLGNEIGKDDSQLQINKKLAQIAESESLDSNQQHLAMLEQIYKQIKSVLNKFSALKLFHEGTKLALHLVKFGSLVSGFATRNTDMDLAILTNCYVNQLMLLQYLCMFIQAEKKQKWGIKLIKNARVPLITVKIKSGKGFVEVDLIFNNVLGVLNSKLLSVYSQVKWVKHLVLLVKLWAKKQELIRDNYFSSYSFNLLVLHFLIHTKRINLLLDAKNKNPDRAPHFKHKKVVKGENQQFDVYFQFKNQPEDVTKIKRVNLYEVLNQFFIYFSKEGVHWQYSQQEQVITIDGSKEKNVEKDKIFTMKDPFDEYHNPGRAKSEQKEQFWKHLKDAIDIMKDKNPKQIEKLFI